MDNIENFLVLFVFGILLLIVIVLYSASKKKEQEERFIRNHRKIFPGMTKAQVIGILGTQYTQSYLQNNVEKLEWKFRRAGYSARIAQGAYMHTGTLTRKISVKFKDNCVIEVKSLNMD